MKKKNLVRMTTFMAGCMIFIFSMSGLRAQTDLKVSDPDNKGGGEAGKVCWDTVTQQEGSSVRFCGSCEYVGNSVKSFWSKEKTCE